MARVKTTEAQNSQRSAHPYAAEWEQLAKLYIEKEAQFFLHTPPHARFTTLCRVIKHLLCSPKKS